jgi:hypothetical protein
LLNLIYTQLLNFVHHAAAIEEQKNRRHREGDDLLKYPNDRHETPCMHRGMERAPLARIPVQAKYYQLQHAVWNLRATRRTATDHADPAPLTPR